MASRVTAREALVPHAHPFQVSRRAERCVQKLAARPIAFLLTLLLVLLGSAPGLLAQTSPTPASKPDENKGILWFERFNGSSNTDGQVMALTSSTGYNFNKYFGVDMGIPIYFIRASSTTTTTGMQSSNGIGDVFVDLRLAVANPLLNFSSTLTGTAPSGDSAKGRSTGHATFNWDNNFEHDFSRLSPFVDVSVGNSLNQRRIFLQPFISFGKVASFEAGTGVQIVGPLSVSASLYADVPWGTQHVFSRFVAAGTSRAGAVRHNRVFEQSHETVGTSALDRDNGLNVGASFTPVRYVDFELGYSRSMHYQLDTVSFGIGLNLSSLVRRRPIH